MSENEKVSEKKVKVEVDGKPREVPPGTYVVSVFKTLVKVEASKELEQFIDGHFVPLNDSANVTIVGGEVFISHVRRGGSSWR